jgi:hypothetical protein
MPDAHSALPSTCGRHRIHSATAIPSPRQFGDHAHIRTREDRTMFTSHQTNAARPSGVSGLFPATGGLRPELAAFFLRAHSELAPRRIVAEQGVLGELRSRTGTD